MATTARIGNPFIETDAVIKARLYDFATGSSTLRNEHKTWLNNMVNTARRGRHFMDVVGYASKTGSAALNLQLSEDRVNSVLTYLNDRSFNPPVRFLDYQGEGAYQAPESDDSPDWRAVELHYYKRPPKKPRNANPKPRQPLPGGRRFRDWEVAAVFGLQGGLGLNFAADLFMFRKMDPPVEEHWYVGFHMGIGLSWGPKLKRLLPLIRKLLTSGSVTGLAATSFTAVTPCNFGDLHMGSFNVSQSSAGVGGGYVKAKLGLRADLWHYNKKGQRNFGRNLELVSNLDISGPALVVGGGISVTGGVLYQIY